MLPLLMACHYGNKKQNGKSDDRSDTSVEGTWQGIEPFHSIDVSGVTKVVVFIRDSTSVMIDGVHVEMVILVFALKWSSSCLSNR